MHPKIVVFSCNWDGWSCIESAANSGLHYPASVKIIRVSCLSRIHAGLIIKAFEMRADGVILVGCESGNCNFGSNHESIGYEYEKARRILTMLGIRKERLALAKLPPFDGHQFVAKLTELSNELKRVPAVKRARITGSPSDQNTRV